MAIYFWWSTIKARVSIVVEAATGRVKQSLNLSTFDNRPKWEALARDDEGPTMSLVHISLKIRLKRGHKRNLRTSRAYSVSVCGARRRWNVIRH